MNYVLERIRKYRLERHWSEYQLAEKADIPQSTISSWYRKDTMPTISSISKICAALGITLADFFSNTDEAKYLNESERELLRCWAKLNDRQKNLIIDFLKTL